MKNANSWPIKRLGELCEINIGKTPSRTERSYWGGDNPWLSIADMNQGRHLSTTSECITDAGVQAANMRIVRPGTILLSYKLSIGKVGIAGIPLYTNEAIAALPIVDRGLDRDYLYWTMKTVDLTENTDRAAMGATLNKKKLLEIEIPLPPLAEQRRIAAVLDKADELRQKRRQALARLDQLTQSVFLDMFGDPVTNPKRWEIVSLENVTLSGSAGLKRGPFGGAIKKECFVPDGFKVYEQKNVIRNDFALGNYYINAEKFKELEGFAVKPGDLLVSCSGTIGRIAEVPLGCKPGVINQALLRMTLDAKKIRTSFFMQLWQSDSFERTILGMTHGTGMSNMKSMAELKSLPIILPPLEQQLGFEEVIREHGRSCGKSARSSIHMDHLFSSLQQRAFRGELFS